MTGKVPLLWIVCSCKKPYLTVFIVQLNANLCLCLHCYFLNIIIFGDRESSPPMDSLFLQKTIIDYVFSDQLTANLCFVFTLLLSEHYYIW